MKSKTIKLFLFTFLMCLSSVGAWAANYEILYGVPVYSADGTTITDVAPQTDFTDDANELKDVVFSDANGNASAMPIDGSVLYANKSGNWTKYFPQPVTEGCVYFSGNYTVSANSSNTFRILGNDDYKIFLSAVNNTKDNGNLDVAVICGEVVNNYVRQPRNAAYGIKSICINLDERIVTYELLISSGSNSYTTKKGTVALPDEVTSVKGLQVAKTNWGAYLDNVTLYSCKLEPTTQSLVDIDFSNPITDGVVNGAVGSMSINGGELNSEGRLMIGKGTNVVDIPSHELIGSVTFNFKLAYGRLLNHHIGFAMVDADGSVIDEFKFRPYDGYLYVNTFSEGKRPDMYYDNKTVLWERYAEFSITYDYNESLVIMKVYNAYNKITTTYAKPMLDKVSVAKFKLYSDYDNAERRCQFDDLKVYATFMPEQTCADIDFSNEVIGGNEIRGNVSSMKWTTMNNFALEDGVLRIGKSKGNVDLKGYTISNRDIVTISFDMMFVGLSNRAIGFYLNDADGNEIVYQKFGVYNSDLGSNPLNLSWDDVYRVNSNNPGIDDAKKTNFVIILDYVNNTITTKTSCSWAKNKTATHIVDMPTEVKPIASFSLEGNYDNDSRRCYFDNLLITSKNGDYTLNKVVVNYQDSNDNDISSKIPQNVKTVYHIPQNASFKPFTEKILTEEYIYTYNSGGDAVVIDGDKDITVVYDKREREKYNLVLNAVATIDGVETLIAENVYKEDALEEEVVKYGYSKYLIYKDKLYEAVINDGDDTYYVNSITMLSSDPIKLEYKEVALEENLTPVYTADLGTGISGNYEQRYSGGSVLSSDKSIELVPENVLTGGYYKIVIQNNRNRGSIVKVGEDVVGTLSTGGSAGSIVITTLSDLAIKEGQSLSVVPNTEVSTWTDNIDYVIVYKITKPVSVKISSVGYSTFSSTMDVDFSDSDITIYTAKVNDDEKTIKLTSLDSKKIPANTGVVLKGIANTYTGYATVGYDKLNENALLANSEEMVSDGSFYVLGNSAEHGVGFYKLTTGKTLAAGKAYLILPASNAKVYRFIFDDDISGIEQIQSSVENEKFVYDLSGRKVENPTKGFYIKNGKKLIMK